MSTVKNKKFAIKATSSDAAGLFITDPEVLGPKFLTIKIVARYYEEDQDREVSQFITKSEAKRLIKRLQAFVVQ